MSQAWKSRPHSDHTHGRRSPTRHQIQKLLLSGHSQLAQPVSSSHGAPAHRADRNCRAASVRWLRTANAIESSLLWRSINTAQWGYVSSSSCGPSSSSPMRSSCFFFFFEPFFPFFLSPVRGERRERDEMLNAKGARTRHHMRSLVRPRGSTILSVLRVLRVGGCYT